MQNRAVVIEKLDYSVTSQVKLQIFIGQIKSLKIQRPSSGGDLPQTGEYNSFPVARRVNSAGTMMMGDDVENGNLGLYQDRPRTFPNMRSKPYTPLVRTLCFSQFVVCYLWRSMHFELLAMMFFFSSHFPFLLQ